MPVENLVHGFIIGTGHTKFALFSSTISSIAEICTILILRNTNLESLAVLGTGVLIWVFTHLTLDSIYYFSNKWQKIVGKKVENEI